MFRKRDTHIHFVGIGGIGMSGIAEVLLTLGYRVTGTDLVASETTHRLQELGAKIYRGHATEHLGDADVVVVSSAVQSDNPEVVAARAQHIPVIPRAEMLAELMRLKLGIAIAGSHGKTTTTSLIASVLQRAGQDPTVVIGGKLNALNASAHLGSSDILVAEADESDGSFLLLNPTIAVITNIDDEHTDHYGSVAHLADAFVGFANRVPFYGTAVVCCDDPGVAAVLPRISKRMITYGFHPEADFCAQDVVHNGSETRFTVRMRNRDKTCNLEAFELHMPGAHNVLNALATIAVAETQGVPIEVTRAALAAFSGVQRRFTIRGHIGDVLVVDDYGHHPTEITATLAGARTSYPDRRLVVVFQPHRYSRLRAHLDAFAACLDEADAMILTDVYSPGEPPNPVVTIEHLFTATQARRPGRWLELDKQLIGLAERLAATARPGDLIITLGAGNITRVSHELTALLAARA